MPGVRSQNSDPFGDDSTEEGALGRFVSVGDVLYPDLGLAMQMCSF